MTLDTNKSSGDTITAAEWNEAATAANEVTDQTLEAADVQDFDTEVSNNSDVSANTTHRTSDGSDHSFIDQDVTSSASPSFAGVTVNDALFDTEYDNGNSGASATIDWNNGNMQKINLDQNTTLSFTDPASPARLQLYITGGGSYSITWPSVTWLTSGGSAPSLAGPDVVTLFYNGTSYIATHTNQS